MLRARTFRSTGTTGTRLTVTHALGAVPDAWFVAERNDHSYGCFFPNANILTNTIDIINSLNSDASVDVVTINYQGRLY